MLVENMIKEIIIGLIVIVFLIIAILPLLIPKPGLNIGSTNEVTIKVPNCYESDEEENTLTENEFEEEFERMEGILDDGDTIILSGFGESMYPTIKDKSKCECNRTDDYEIGDIIVFYDESLGNFFIAHRIIDIEGNEFIMMGDNNTGTERIESEDIICEIEQS